MPATLLERSGSHAGVDCSIVTEQSCTGAESRRRGAYTRLRRCDYLFTMVSLPERWEIETLDQWLVAPEMESHDSDL